MIPGCIWNCYPTTLCALRVPGLLPSHVQGVIGPGGVQWMTAGRGVVHSEMPVVEDGLLHGFQLW